VRAVDTRMDEHIGRRLSEAGVGDTA